jgi:pimeloyl-ACP methyl ester carboxylesterase
LADQELGLLLLHALPLDGSMWASQMDLLPGAVWAPTLYGLGDSIEAWAAAVLQQVPCERLIVAGCSVGGSCALEVAALAPERVAALVLIGAKAGHRPEPAFRDTALALLQGEGVEAAWARYWAPLFSRETDPAVVEAAKQLALRQDPGALARGVSVFHSRPNREALVASWPRPLWVVTGEEDPTPGLEACRRLAASAPRAQLRVLPSCGHYVSLEQPHVLRALLTEVLEQVHAGT